MPLSRKLFLFVLMLSFLFVSFSLHAKDVKVKGYYKKDGTYVKPHVRTAPDGNPYNNYSFPGNYNPNTGKTTTGNPDTYLNNYNKPKSQQDNTFTYQSPGQNSYSNDNDSQPEQYQIPTYEVPTYEVPSYNSNLNNEDDSDTDEQDSGDDYSADSFDSVE